MLLSQLSSANVCLLLYSYCFTIVIILKYRLKCILNKGNLKHASIVLPFHVLSLLSSDIPCNYVLHRFNVYLSTGENYVDLSLAQCLGHSYAEK